MDSYSLYRASEVAWFMKSSARRRWSRTSPTSRSYTFRPLISATPSPRWLPNKPSNQIGTSAARVHRTKVTMYTRLRPAMQYLVCLRKLRIGLKAIVYPQLRATGLAPDGLAGLDTFQIGVVWVNDGLLPI